MTPAELKAIANRAEAATKGPWVCKVPYADFPEDAVVVGPKYGGMGEEMAWSDAEFIAHARTDVPKLLEYVRDLQTGVVMSERDYEELQYLRKERDRLEERAAHHTEVEGMQREQIEHLKAVIRKCDRALSNGGIRHASEALDREIDAVLR